MRSWFLIPLVIIIGVSAWFVLSKNDLVKTQVQNLAPTTESTQEEAAENLGVVTIRNFSFGPSTITIKVGDSVTWTNSDAVTHTATADDGSWDTGSISKGESKNTTFNTPGTYTYHCTPHPFMKGTVVVTP